MATQPPIPTNRRWRRRAVLNLGHFDFEIVSDFGIRISDFKIAVSKNALKHALSARQAQIPDS